MLSNHYSIYRSNSDLSDLSTFCESIILTSNFIFLITHLIYYHVYMAYHIGIKKIGHGNINTNISLQNK